MTAGLYLLAAVGERLAGALHRYGYGAVAVGVLLENLGLPVPGEAMLMAAAGLAQHGELSIVLVFLTGTVAAIAGDNLGFEIGRKLGRGIITDHFPGIFTAERLARTDRFFERRGRLAVFLARFVPGVRVIAAITAGASTMRRVEFVVANALGALTWAAWVCALGYFGTELGRSIMPGLVRVHLVGWLVAVLALAALAVSALWLRHRRGGLTDDADQG